MYGRRQKKFPFTVRTTGRAIPFRFHLISVRLPFLSVFKPFLFCPKGSPSVLVNDSSVIVTELDQELPSMVIEHHKGSQQFSDRDRARAT